MGVCNCSMYCCTLLYVHSSIAIILMGKRELIALLNLSSWCLVMVKHRSKKHATVVNVSKFVTRTNAMFMSVEHRRCFKMIGPENSNRIFFCFSRELSEANRQYKDKLKQYVRDKVPIENTDIGRIARLVRKIIKENELMHADTYNDNSNKAVP